MRIAPGIGRDGWLAIVLVTCASLFIVYPLFQPGYFIGHELLGPQFRIYGIDLAIRAGQFPPKVLPNLVNGFGYGWSIFYAPLSYDLTWLIHALGLSITGSIKVFHFLVVIGSGLSMFLLVRRVSASTSAATVAALFYVTAPYRIVDLYVRNAYAESLAFALLPVLFLGLYEVTHGQLRRWWLLGLGMTGLFLTHSISAFYGGVLACLYLAVYARQLWNDTAVYAALGKAVLLWLLLSAYFLLPLLEHRLFGHFAIFDANTLKQLLVSAESLHAHSVHFGQLFSHDFNYAISRPEGQSGDEMPYLIGVPLVACAAVSLFIIRASRAPRFFLFCAAAGVLLTLVTLPWFPWQFVPGPFLYIQFPWRLLLFVSFFLSIAASLVFTSLDRSGWKGAALALVAVVLCGYVFSFIRPDYRAEISDAIIPPVENIRRPPIIVGTSLGEYLPLAAMHNFSYLRFRDGGIRVLEGRARGTITATRGTTLEFMAETGPAGATIELPFIYYMGYTAVALADNGVEREVAVFESPTGFCAIKLAGKARVTLRYAGTRVAVVGNLLTALGIGWLCVLAFSRVRNRAAMRLHPVPA